MNRYNPVKLIGTVKSVELHKNSAIMWLDIDGEQVKTQGFSPVVPYLKLFKEGDRVKVDATLQSNDRRSNPRQAPRTIAVNHIGPAKENSENMNSWVLFGRPVRITELPNGGLTAIIKVEGEKFNYIKVLVPADKVNGFSELTRGNFIAVSGKFVKGACIVKKWRHARPNTEY